MNGLIHLVVLVLCFAVISSTLIGSVNEAIEENFKEYIVKKNLTAREYVTELFHKVDREYNEVSNDIVDACSSQDNTTVCKELLKENCIDVQSLLSHSSSDQEGSVLNWFPSLVYYAYSPVCSSLEPEVGEPVHVKMPPEKVWGYGIGFVAIICGVANVGGVMTPFMNHRYFQRLLLFCVALAVGTLGATGMLVLIPESLNLTTEDSPVPNYHFKMATVMGGIYFFYVSERLLKFWFHRNKKQEKDIKIPEVADAKRKTADNDHMLLADIPNSDEVKDMLPDDVEVELSKPQNTLTTVALMILIGDALHNFVDGIAIGAAFTENTYLGISVSLSVICEELPHELGDIAILLHTGLSMKKSLCYNFLAALTIVIGLVIGILLGENTNANTWIFAVAGGMFVYISLVDMLPEMADQAKHVEETGLESKWTAFIIQNLGLLVGFLIILMLVMYGHNISV